MSESTSEIKVSRENVFAAADRLHRAGKRVSNRTVRRELDGGSPNDILERVREWKAAARGAAEAAADGNSLPDRVTQAFSHALDVLRQAVREEAKSEFDIRSADCAKQVANALEERDSAQLDFQEADAELDAVKTKLAAAEAQLSAAEALTDTLHQRLRQAEAEREVVASRESELRNHLDDLKTELEISHRLQQAECRQTAVLRDELTRLGAELEAALLKAANAGAELLSTRATLAGCQEQLAIATAEASAKANAAMLECEAARLEAREQAEAAARLRGELDGVQRQADEFIAVLRENAKAVAAKPITEADVDANQS